MSEFDIGDKTFRVNGLMEPRKAFHVARRIAPLGGALKDLLPLVMKPGGFDANNAEAWIALFEPITHYLAQMPEDDANYVIDACMDVIQYKTAQDRGWVKVATGGAMMFDWITMPMMVRMVVEVVRVNLAGFFPGLADALNEA